MMQEDRIGHALARIDAAMTRIAAAHTALPEPSSASAGGSLRTAELVNTHERLREQVAESLRQLDDLIGQLDE